jgi:flagellar hook-length control protein FliK
MTIQLKPELLGSVQLQLQMREGGMHVKISADDPAVRGAINAQIGSLIVSLSEKGLKIADVEVTYTGADSGDLAKRGSPNQNRREDGARQTTRIKSASSSVYFLETPEVGGGYLSPLSSVEYSA